MQTLRHKLDHRPEIALSVLLAQALFRGFVESSRRGRPRAGHSAV